ncbi:MAG TPA: GNAT family N-acetyltransferase [Anaerolineae bacterium]|nr:GNAT family N-acetyltransferase [Anaerolineae bacterium]
MVAHATQPTATFSGARPINLSRDLVSIANLIDRAFADDMDDSGRAAVREMRLLGRLAFLFSWAESFVPQGEGWAPGFVWIEEGDVVANATVRRLSLFGRGWMIGNVAVVPKLRGRGIARSLMNACIDLARQRNGDWIALQVRSNNAIARGLYSSLNFQTISETIELIRTEPDRVTPPDQSSDGHLRIAEPRDTDKIFALAQAANTESMRWIEPQYRTQFELGFDRRLANFLSGTFATWRVIEVDKDIVGASSIKVNRWTGASRLGLWVTPAYRGRVEQTLVDAVLSELPASTRSISARIVGDHTAGRDALLSRSFTIVRALTNMRLDLH